MAAYCEELAKAGDLVKATVMEVDIQRKREGLSMRLTDDAQEPKAAEGRASGVNNDRGQPRDRGAATRGGKPQSLGSEQKSDLFACRLTFGFHSDPGCLARPAVRRRGGGLGERHRRGCEYRCSRASQA